MSLSRVSGLSSHYRSYLSTVNRAFLKAQSAFICEQATANVDPACDPTLSFSFPFFWGFF